MKVLIVTSGVLPVPATKGGAVENLIEYIIKENEIHNKLDLTIVSIYDESAYKKSLTYKSSKFIFVKIPHLISCMDKLAYLVAKNILKKNKVLAYRYNFQRFWMVYKTQKLLLNNNYDKVVMENHVILLQLFKNHKVNNKYKDKYYYHEHNVINNELNAKNVILQCRKIITVSDYISKEFIKRYPKYSKEKIVKLPNVSDLNRFGKMNSKFRDDFYKKFGIKKDDKIIMFAGRLDATKGGLEVIKAFSKIKDDNVKLVIVGSYAYGNNISNGFDLELKKYAKVKEDKIIFTGYVDFDDMPTLYKIADVMVLPSIWDDPAPLSIIESLCSGCALITTNSGGIIEYAKDIAIVLERDDKLVNNIYMNIVSLLENEDKRKKLGEKAFNKTRGWTTEWFYNNFIDIIKE